MGQRILNSGKQALAIFDKIGDKGEIPGSLDNMGSLYQR